MARSCRQVIEETLGLLQAFSLDEAQSTTLSSVTIAPGDTTFTVSPVRGLATGISVGVVEIDQEMIYVDSVDETGTCTVPAWGRGYLGTTAATHTQGARVISQPTLPRAWVLQAVNETIDRVFPELFVPKVYETTTTYPRFTYDMPADFEFILAAKWQVPGPTYFWKTINNLRSAPGGGTLTGDTAETVDAADKDIMPGRPIQFVYAKRPGHLVNETDDFEAVTGLNIGTVDVITLGAAAGFPTISQELSRLQLSSVEQQNRSQLVAPSAALTSSNLLDRKFQQRLQEEHDSLMRVYPPRIVRRFT